MRPKCRREDPLVLPSARVEDRDVLQSVDANGVEMVKGVVRGSPVEGGEVGVDRCLQGI